MKPPILVFFLALNLALSLSAMADSETGRGCADKNKVEVKGINPIADVVEKLNLICGKVKLQVGESCITSKGFEFKLIGLDNKGKELYEDVATGLQWSDKLDKSYKFSDADKACNELGSKLPALEDFIEADNHGFREVLPSSGYSYKQPGLLFIPDQEIHTHDTYWTANFSERKILGFNSVHAYFFKMAKGYSSYDYFRSDANASFIHVRCISKKNK